MVNLRKKRVWGGSRDWWRMYVVAAVFVRGRRGRYVFLFRLFICVCLNLDLTPRGRDILL